MLRVLIFLGLLSTGAHAQQMPCGSEAEMTALVLAKFGESAKDKGLAGPRMRVTMFYNSATGSWTFVGTDVTGYTCVIAAGSEMWPVPPVLGKPL